MPKREEKTIAKNRRAFHDYEILETYEAGIELTGTEVRSLRENNCQLTDCFALIRNGEVWLNNVHISPYSNGSIFNPDPDRRRKLLLHKKQIRYLDAKVAEKGLAIVPLKMYFNEDGRVKVELALARGKKLYDKRASMKERDTKREIDRALKERVRSAGVCGAAPRAGVRLRHRLRSVSAGCTTGVAPWHVHARSTKRRGRATAREVVAS